MIYVGIDVAKDKHDCCIMNAKSEFLDEIFTISNTLEEFNNLFLKISTTSQELSNIKVGLEATGHYSYNLLGFLLDKGLTPIVINPLV
ncbi:IS110 family transposase [Paenibacillus sp. GM2]|uniref:IS110 family transposase n=1 Tax=Paenibacillus sp. GM2 TaxID=1622070 RepID=UPI000839999F|nr:transposase [Paenibacillus sp. GM2]